MASYYKRDPRVTNDRTPPKWFLDRLKDQDPDLRVEWWNDHPIEGPHFRLIRMLEGGRFQVVQGGTFHTEDEMHAMLRWLKENDLHRRGVEGREHARAIVEEMRREAIAEKRMREDRLAGIASNTLDKMGLHKDRMYSIAGVNTRVNWNKKD